MVDEFHSWAVGCAIFLINLNNAAEEREKERRNINKN